MVRWSDRSGQISCYTQTWHHIIKRFVLFQRLKITLPMDPGQRVWVSLFYMDKNMIDILFDIIGMTGTFLVVGAFFLLQLDKVSPDGIKYNMMNLSGAVLLLISLCYNFNLASFVIELFWIVASLIGLYKYFKKRRLATA